MIKQKSPKIKTNLPIGGGERLRGRDKHKISDNLCGVGSRSRKCRIFLILLIGLLFVIVGSAGVNAYGNLTTYWITPTTDTDVQQDEFFKVQIGVNCTGGDCGDVNVTLDPKEVKKAIEKYKAQQNIITGDVVEEVEDGKNWFEMILDFIKGVFGK